MRLEWELLGILAVSDAAEIKPDVAIIAGAAWQSMHAVSAAPMAFRRWSDN